MFKGVTYLFLLVKKRIEIFLLYILLIVFNGFII